MTVLGPTYAYDTANAHKLGIAVEAASYLHAVRIGLDKYEVRTFDNKHVIASCEYLASLNKVSQPVQGIGCKRPNKGLGVALNRPINVNGELGAVVKCESEADAALLYNHVLSWISPQYVAYIFYDKIKIKHL